MAQAKRVGHKQFGEIFTPPALVEKMLDALPADTWNHPMMTFLEPCVGNGNFIAGIVPRLMVGIEWFEPDPVLRYKWIFEHMIHAVEIQQRLIDECIVRFGLENIKHNFVCADALTYFNKV
jgi:hypothetical protein